MTSGMGIIRKILCFLLFVSSALAGPAPEWRLPDYPRRAVFSAPREAEKYVLVSVPFDQDPTGTPFFAAYDSAGLPLAYRVAHVGPEKAHVLVRIGTENAGETGQKRDSNRRSRSEATEQYVLYYGASADSFSAESRELRDPFPVGIAVHASSGKGVPNSWQKMLYLYRRSGKPIRILRRSNFEKLPALKEEGERDKRKLWIVHSRSFLLCTEDGVYGFALDCKNAGFLLVDGEIAASWPGEHNSGKWSKGPPTFLKAGPHLVEVLNASRKRPKIRVGWTTPSGDPGRDVAAIPQRFLLTAYEAVETRIEKINKSLHPNFSLELMSPYSFRNNPAVFVPVKFKNTTKNWITDTMQCRWRFEDGSVEGEAPVHVFTGAKRHKAVMEVRDNLGFAGSCVRIVDCRLVKPREYAVAFEVLSLPAVRYASDTVEPLLSLSGRIPDKTVLKVDWRVEERSGAEKIFRKDVRLSGESIYIPLIKAEAGSIASIRWRVEHHGVELESGTVKFQVPPFDNLPTAIKGDSMYDGKGIQLVLVPYRNAKSFNQPPISTKQAFGKLVCIDDSLAVPGLMHDAGGAVFHSVLARIVDGPDKPEIKYVSLPSWDKSSWAYGPLLKFVHTPAAIDANTDVVILSIGLRDIMEMGDPNIFERHAAALSDIISVSMNCPMIWITPPPYPLDPGHVRSFAAAIRKVADARGIPVADLFTAFRGMSGAVSPFSRGRDLVLSDRGHELAARIIARSLLSAGNVD